MAEEEALHGKMAEEKAIHYSQLRDYILSLKNGDLVDLFYEAMSFAEQNGGTQWNFFVCSICKEKFVDEAAFSGHLEHHRDQKLDPMYQTEDFKAQSGSDVYMTCGIGRFPEDLDSLKGKLLHFVQSLLHNCVSKNRFSYRAFSWIQTTVQRLKPKNMRSERWAPDSLGDLMKELDLESLNVIYQFMEHLSRHCLETDTRFVEKFLKKLKKDGVRSLGNVSVKKGPEVLTVSALGQVGATDAHVLVAQWKSQLEHHSICLMEFLAVYDKLTEMLNNLYSNKSGFLHQKLEAHSLSRAEGEDAPARAEGDAPALESFLVNMREGHIILLPAETVANIPTADQIADQISEALNIAIAITDCQLLKVLDAIDQLEVAYKLNCSLDYREFMVPLLQSYLKSNANALSAKSVLGKRRRRTTI